MAVYSIVERAKYMTSEERMITAMLNKQPDTVPVAPDMSNMIPCRLTGLPWWDIYLYRKIPLWKAYIRALNHFNFDGWLPYYMEVEYLDENTYIVEQTPERIVTRRMEKVNGQERWSGRVVIYAKDNPATDKNADILGMSAPPKWYEPVDVSQIPPQKTDIEMYDEVKAEMGTHGVVGMPVWLPGVMSPEGIYEYYDDYNSVKERSLFSEAEAVRYTKNILEKKPDFVFLGYSGGLTFQTPEMFRDLALPALQKVTALCRAAGVPSQLHCCGRSRALVEMAANESDLDSINPLEIPPMGDCDLAEVKRSCGSKIGLMGNLHTTSVMLFGTPDEVAAASRKAIDDAAYGGGFILSTGDQCGRDTPDENIFTMIETARTYGKYA